MTKGSVPSKNTPRLGNQKSPTHTPPRQTSPFTHPGDSPPLMQSQVHGLRPEELTDLRLTHGPAIGSRY